MKPITWTPKLVDIKKIKPTPVNYKIKNALGEERFKESLKNFGLAGTVVCNTDLTLIDGNSRLDEAKKHGENKIWVSLPDHKLSQKQFQEMSAIFDYSTAGDVDIKRIERDLGSSEDFLTRYNMAIPIEKLNKMGNNTPSETRAKKIPVPEKVEIKKDEMIIQLVFTTKQEKEFRDLEDVFMKKYRTKSTSETVLKVFKTSKK